MPSPNSTVQSIITVTDVYGNPVTNLSAISFVVTYPDGTTATQSLVSGVTNVGSGQYKTTYVTKMEGEHTENWTVTAFDGVTVANYTYRVGVTY